VIPRNAKVADLHSALLELLSSMKLVRHEGDLVALDSLSLIDLVLTIEAAFNVSIPNSALTIENFESVDAMLTMLIDILDNRSTA
jgi:acyl carrier protein